MENTVIFYQGMDIDPDDFNNLQSYVQGTFDDLVGDAVTAGQRYAGFSVTKSSPTAVTVAPGRLYSGGKMFEQTAQVSQDFITTLPVAGQKIVTVVLLGAVQQGSVTEREFLINEDTGQSQPKAVALENSRVATVTFAYGAETPTATAPLIQSGYTKVADILLTTTGVSSITMYAPNALPSIDTNSGRLTNLETFQSAVGPQVTTLASGLASLANALNSTASQKVIIQLLLSVADLNAKVGIPSNTQLSATDYLLDGTQSDLTNPLSSCIVSEGIRFPWDNLSTQVMNTFNPFDTTCVIKNGLLLPAYTRYLRQSTGPRTNTVNANSFSYNQVTYQQQTTTTTRTRYGSTFDVCTNSAFWQSGTYNPLTSVFTLPSGATYSAALNLNGLPYAYTADGFLHVPVRLQQFWTDTVNSTYWTGVVGPQQQIPGFHMFESQLIGQDQWLDAVGVVLGNLDAQGDVTLIVTEANSNAQPNITKVLSQTTIPYAQLVASAENVFSLPSPILLNAGKRISVGVVTTGGHQIATTDGANFPQGTFFALSPSGFAQGDLTKHLCLNFYGIKFSASTISINLTNLQLPGGMTGIDIQAGTIKPSSTNLVYEIQPQGSGTWTTLSGTNAGVLNAGGALPPNVGLRVTMTGTPDMMPALLLKNSIATATRPLKSLAHVWPLNPRTPAIATKNITVTTRWETYQSAYHAVGQALLTQPSAGAAYTTQTAPSSVTSVVGTDGSYTVTCGYVLPTAVSSYKVLNTATTTSALIPFHGAYIKDYCL